MHTTWRLRIDCAGGVPPIHLKSMVIPTFAIVPRITLRLLGIFAVIVALVVQLGYGATQPPETLVPVPTAANPHLTLRHDDLWRPAAPAEFEALEAREPVDSAPLLKDYPFLRLRAGQVLWKGIRAHSGKGESWTSEGFFLAAGGTFFELGLRGADEFVHFDWDVSVENAQQLFRAIVGDAARGVVLLTAEQYAALEVGVAGPYPETVVRRQALTISPAHLVRQGGKAYVHCEAVVYIQDGRYYDEGEIENAVVKYSTNLGDGFLETEIAVLIQGPYEMAPLYWGGINGMKPPRDADERKATLLRFERMKEFNAAIEKLLGEIGAGQGAGRAAQAAEIDNSATRRSAK